MDRIIYKLMGAAEWAAFDSDGRFDGSAADRADGFIHYSAAHQVAGTAAKHFAGRRDLVLVAVDAGALGDTLAWEPSRGGQLFPHGYGVLPRSAVISAEPVPTDPAGGAILPDPLPVH